MLARAMTHEEYYAHMGWNHDRPTCACKSTERPVKRAIERQKQLLDFTPQEGELKEFRNIND